MSSDILGIYNALAAKIFSVGATAVPVFNLGGLVNQVQTAHLPCRLLLPVGQPMEGRNGQYIALGTLASVTWMIPDLMLWQLLGQGIGLQDFAQDLVNYCGLYADMLRTFRTPTPGGQCVLRGWTLTPGVFEWPAQSTRWYAGVECLIEIQEVLSG